MVSTKILTLILAFSQLAFLTRAKEAKKQSHSTSEIRHECMHTSRPYGYPIGDKDSSSRKFVTNMHSIVKAGGDQTMFMRTAMVTICSDLSYIHGIKVAL